MQSKPKNVTTRVCRGVWHLCRQAQAVDSRHECQSCRSDTRTGANADPFHADFLFALYGMPNALFSQAFGDYPSSKQLEIDAIEVRPNYGDARDPVRITDRVKIEQFVE